MKILDLKKNSHFYVAWFSMWRGWTCEILAGHMVGPRYFGLKGFGFDFRFWGTCIWRLPDFIAGWICGW